jgi:ferrochelatase
VSERVSVLLMAYGTPSSLDDLEAYYTHIRRGRPPEPAPLAELRGRYEAIGGVSPLTERTEAQRLAIQAALDERAPDMFSVTLGMKHAAPFIEDAVAAVADAGLTRAVGLVLAPHYSAASVGTYLDRAASTGRERGVNVRGIESWHLEPAYLDFLAAGIQAERAALPPSSKLLFTAHSLPERVLAGDPYPDQLQASALAVTERLGLQPWPDWAVAWQSAGRTPEPWRGPDILDVIRTLASTGRSAGVLVCAQGFVSDHLEVVYDLDIEARGVADEVGLALARTPAVNDDPKVMAALADRVVDVASEAGWT